MFHTNCISPPHRSNGLLALRWARISNSRTPVSPDTHTPQYCNIKPQHSAFYFLDFLHFAHSCFPSPKEQTALSHAHVSSAIPTQSVHLSSESFPSNLQGSEKCLCALMNSGIDLAFISCFVQLHLSVTQPLRSWGVRADALGGWMRTGLSLRDSWRRRARPGSTCLRPGRETLPCSCKKR